VNGSLVRQATGRVTVALPDDVPVAKENAPRIEYFDIGPDYFATLRVPVLAGREFSEHDDPSTPLVAMVNQSLAKRLWQDGNAVGQPVILNGKEFRVVGVVKDHRVHVTSEASPAMAYVAFWQNAISPQIDARIAIRVADDPLRALRGLQHAASVADPAVPVTELLAMESQMRATFTELRLGGAVLVVGAAFVSPSGRVRETWWRCCCARGFIRCGLAERWACSRVSPPLRCSRAGCSASRRSIGGRLARRWAQWELWQC
jgi:hypothetical protein